MLRIIDGDISEAEESIIVHQVNCQGKMNSGVAKSIRKKFPKAYDDYMKIKDKPSKLGEVWFTMSKNEDSVKYIGNLFGQLNYGYDRKRYTNYEALYTGLERVKEIAKLRGLSVAIPYKIGSDRGGADWNVVRAMIEVIFSDYEVTLYRYEG